MVRDAGMAHLCLATDDLDAGVARLSDIGIAVSEAPHKVGGDAFNIVATDPRYLIKRGLHRATLAGPDNVVIELLEMKKVAPGRFELPSLAPKAGMIDHYTTGLCLTT